MQLSPVTRSKRSAQQSYDRLSRWYDLLAGSSEGPFRRLGLELLDLRPGERVLEIGCGTGQALREALARVGAQGAALGLDLSTGMLRRSRAAAPKAGLLCADGAHLPLAGGWADAVFLSFSLELFDTPEIPSVLAGCVRVMRPGGRLCAVSLSRLGPGSLMLRLYERLHERAPALADCRPIYLRAALESAGLLTRRVELRRMWGLPVEIVLAQNRV